MAAKIRAALSAPDRYKRNTVNPKNRDSRTRRVRPGMATGALPGSPGTLKIPQAAAASKGVRIPAGILTTLHGLPRPISQKRKVHIIPVRTLVPGLMGYCSWLPDPAINDASSFARVHASLLTWSHILFLHVREVIHHADDECAYDEGGVLLRLPCGYIQ